MTDPAQSCLQQSEAVFLGHRLDNTQSFKGGISEVTLPIIRSCGARVTISAFCWNVFRLVFSRKETTCKRVVDDDVKTVPVAGRNKFSLDIACYRTLSASVKWPEFERREVEEKNEDFTH
jgi:hypothetical protein